MTAYTTGYNASRDIHDNSSKITDKLWQFWLDLGGFLLQVRKIDQSFCFFYKHDLLQLRNVHTKFRSSTCNFCEVMVVLVGFGWISATGTKNWSILLLFLINMMYYSYEMRVQNLEGLCAIAVKLWQFWLDLGGFLLQVRKIDQSFCFFFINIIYYSYEMRLQNFKGLRSIAVKLW